MRLDNALRLAALRGLAGLLPRPRGTDALSARRVLLLRHDRIGDMLMSTGLLRALASRPNLVIDVLASPANAAVLEQHPAVRKVHVLGPGLRGLIGVYRALRQERYDAVLDGLVLKPSVNSRTALLLFASGAPVRVGIGGRRHDFLYTHRVRPPRDDAHHVEYLAALGQPFGVDALGDQLRPDLVFSPEERARAEAVWQQVPGAGPRLLVNVSTGKSWSRWLDERTVAVLRHAHERWPSLKIIVTGLPAEQASCSAVADAVGACWALSTTLRGALAAVAASDVVFTPDTSIAHAAASTRRPVVVMLPRVTSMQFAPFRAGGRVVVADGDTLAALGVGPVIAALDDVLGALDGEQRVGLAQHVARTDLRR